MAISMAALSRRLTRALSSNPNPSLRTFCVAKTTDSDLSDADTQSPPSSSSSSSSFNTRTLNEPLLENGLDMGIYKAILVGRVGQKPIQKKLRNGMTLTIFSVGTGGIRSNRRPLPNESPKDYANRASVQWHRVCVYPERLGSLVLDKTSPGSILYLEGNLEAKVFTDPITGLARRVREISIRRNGRIMFLGKVNNCEEPTQAELRGFLY